MVNEKDNVLLKEGKLGPCKYRSKTLAKCNWDIIPSDLLNQLSTSSGINCGLCAALVILIFV